jgi:hypothetical protein
LWFHDVFCVGAGRVSHRASQAADGAGRDGGRLRQSCGVTWRLVSSSCEQTVRAAHEVEVCRWL